MSNQLRGLAFLLFGILCVLLAAQHPWLPGLGDVLDGLCQGAGFVAGVVGLVFVFKKNP